MAESQEIEYTSHCDVCRSTFDGRIRDQLGWNKLYFGQQTCGSGKDGGSHVRFEDMCLDCSEAFRRAFREMKVERMRSQEAVAL